MDVAGAEGEPIGLADDRAPDDLRPDGKVASHLADDEQLLGILLAEVGALGSDEVEENGDNGRHAFEMAGPSGTLERVSERSDGDGRVEPGRIHLVDQRRKDDVRPFGATDLEVPFFVTWIDREVVR